jgi:drug/metabolite transporter (DMT)-like permease
MRATDWIWIVAVGAIWGCSFFFNAILIRELGPLWVAAGRVSIAAIACWCFFFALSKRLPNDPGLIIKLGLVGIFSYAVPFTLFPLSQGHIPSGVAAIINALTPITTVIVSNFWPGGERATVTKSFGVISGFIGAALLAAPALMSGGNAQLWAIGVCFLATVVYAFALNINRQFARIDPTTIAALSLTGAAIGSLPVALTFEGIPVVTRPETWAAWLGLGVLATAFTFQVMYRILPRVGATNFAATTFISPVSAILLGSFVLGETLLPTHFMGMAAIFLGLLLIDGRILSLRRGAVAR